MVTRKALEENAGADWNAFIELIVMTEYSDLLPSQRSAHPAFWYESEVRNGGHFQYFCNRRLEHIEATPGALVSLAAEDQAEILGQTLAHWKSAARLAPADVLEYAAIACESEFDDADRAFYACQTPLIEVLRRHFERHEAVFIVRE
jgi:hypothetical protein